MLHELSFKGQWRQYQRRILAKSDTYISDGKIHLVAAPGSGKTTLGIEFISCFGNPSLILVPTVTIRKQWGDRIKQAFLNDVSQTDQLISQDLNQPKIIPLQPIKHCIVLLISLREMLYLKMRTILLTKNIMIF